MDQPVISAINHYLEQLHREFAGLTEGEVASYIPELSHADPAWFGIAIATVDGHVYQVGDTRQGFTIQSASKPFVYGLALEEHGLDYVLNRVGVEPSGEAFNSISLEPGTGRPLNPMINAGAIATASMVQGDSDPARLAKVLGMFERFTGHPMKVDETVYLSERATGHRNRALAHLMHGFGIVEGNPEASLDLYFRQCSVVVNCRDLALLGACLANNGINPVTGVRALSEKHVPRVLSVMGSCGMYDYSGEWLYRIGMPAKSGVGGGLLAVLPGQLAIAVFSPPLDPRGNSCRGIAVCERISDDLKLHLFHPLRSTTASTIRVAYRANEVRSRRTRSPAQEAMLSQQGARVQVYELQGELAFGATESLLEAVGQEGDEPDFLVFDMRHVVNVDHAAGWLLIEFARIAHGQGRTVLFVGCDNKYPFQRRARKQWNGIDEAGVFALNDIDRALEWCENRLLERNGLAVDEMGRVSLARSALCAGLDAVHGEELERIGRRVEYRPNETVFRIGDAGDALFIVLHGELEAHIHGPHQEVTRLSTFIPGNYFGELPLASGGARTANVRAVTHATCIEVSYAALSEGLKVGLLSRMATDLARKLAGQARVQKVLG